ncbi:ATP12 family chaperone protein [Pontivivens insulae]|uniref:ATPase n=1 Tax=Pontivivens insulae TaxID=1639689 RepID=A0A2R8A665_9RHOB|nr:ATP12 family protein [Pontivivens insulae]RED17847.1 chaperone required for assembly of F1-ATPase [Pontivivens insulae]SPF27737.1 hypothetical protein POI8812_00030 [Pontivivens insulae]
MSEWAAKRFWKQADVAKAEGGWTVTLDGRNVRTPGKQLLIVPSHALAQRIAAEWHAQDEKINPLSMPFTRSANSAIEKVAPQRDDVIEMLASYGETDLLCYRADYPDSLIARQAAAWDPMLDWAADTYDARLLPVAGLIPQPQPAQSLANLKAQLAQFDDYELTALHDLVTLSGSLVLGLAVAAGRIDAASAWPVAELDALFQQEQWGEDEEAVAERAIKEAAFRHAETLLHLIRKG